MQEQYERFAEEQSRHLPTRQGDVHHPAEVSPEFVDTDTPTVSFRLHPRLRLRFPAQSSSTQGCSTLAAPSNIQSPAVPTLASTTLVIPGRSSDPTLEASVPTPHQQSAESSHQVSSPASHSLHETAEQILLRLKSKTDPDQTRNLINVTRDDVLSGAKRGFKRTTFKDERCLNVMFAGEPAIDDGGPSREFYRLVLRAICDSNIFEGPRDARDIALDITAEKNQEYFQYGRMIGYVLAHGGPPPTFLSERTYSIISGHADEHTVLPADISDDAMRRAVQKVEAAQDKDSFNEAVAGVEHILQYIGGETLNNFSRQEELVAALTFHLVVKRKKEVIEQFTAGLSCLGVYDEVKRNSEAMKCLFIHQRKEVDPIFMDNIFKVVFSADPESNRGRSELRTQTYWRDYLQDLDEDGRLGDLLSFTTGLDSVPPLGFEPPPRLEFSHPDNIHDLREAVPYSNTCANSIRIPVLPEYDMFKERMNLALELGNMFTNH